MYSLHPPDDASGSADRTRGKDKGTISHDSGTDIRLASMGGRKVARLHFVRTAPAQQRYTGNEGGDTLYGKASYVDASPGVPVYWLPWDMTGAIVKLKIPVKGSRLAGQSDPDRFFTAAINGCSIFIDGNAQNPTVYHAGGDTGQNGPAAQAKFWRDLVARLDPSAIWEINKEDYIKNSAVRDQKGEYSTEAAQRYKAWLENTTIGQLEIEDVRPWACVMGIRDAGGNWSFYLQENATVGYYVLKKKSHAFKKPTMVREKETYQQTADTAIVVVDRKREMSRPLRVTEIFPNHVIGARVFQPLPRLRHG